MERKDYDNPVVNDVSHLVEVMRRQQVELIINNIKLFFSKNIGDFTPDRIEYTLRNHRGES